MTRKSWDKLDDAYRKRLEKHGITRSQHEAGVPLPDARGHKRTPEHPLPPGESVPKRYERWANSRAGTPIKMLTADGDVWLTDVSVRHRSLIGSHWNAVQSYLYDKPMPRAFWWNGNTRTALRPFKAPTVTGSQLDTDNSVGSPEKFRFMTDAKAIVQWMRRQERSFPEMYRTVA
ncbi:hypothetical protein [Actinocrispum wychmicini]|uniref:Uncharacterized protein n=1 Tax=Actinocrispum wychmicini TaxID=1213861 RepID=A0A4R2JAK1_9PSEU|nr:hypothetical protein [Actinocrispum wychmicini]TCO52999.1 hypothetical protein EV192_111193 [Actinocrispum wychmicini]